MSQSEANHHVAGLSTFINDIPAPENMLHAVVIASEIASGQLLSVDYQQALKQPGVIACLTANDIPGCNQIGDIVPDERLLVKEQIKFIGKPVALLVAETEKLARSAAQFVKLACQPSTPILDYREAFQKGSLFGETRTFTKGETEAAFKAATTVVQGRVDMGAQEHLYFETQIAVALPIDGSRIKIFSATQSPSAVQKQVARVLNLPMHQVEVEAPRLGGAFGGKEEQAKPWAALAALAAHKLQRPVKLNLTRQEDMRFTGKRHPYSADYRLGLDKNRKIIAYQVMLYQDGGAVADLSTAVLERSLFHATNAYAIPNVLIRAASCRTNHPSNTALRGFGAPQAIFTLESALDHAAQQLKCPCWQLQQKNLIAPGYTFPYGMTVADNSLGQCWKHLWEHYNASARLKDIKTYNQQQKRYKKALTFTPLCFGISFTATHLNQASAVVHVFTDGSVSVSCSAVEMGQGVFEKIKTVAARSLYLEKACINIEATNSSRTANMSPTAASVGSDINGLATQIACQDIIERLLRFAAEYYSVDIASLFFANGALYSRSPGKYSPSRQKHASQSRIASWTELVTQAYFSRVNLSAHAHYATPHIHFERTKEQGHPFAYYACGASMIEASVDSLLGTYRINHIDVVYDLGESLDQRTDTGQMEGGLVQGVGYSCMEEIIWNSAGQLQTDSFASYKIPDLISAPTIDISFLSTADNPYAPFSSKAIGEPPLLLGIGSYFSIREALREATSSTLSGSKNLNYSLPMTPEKALFLLYPNEITKAK